MPTFNYKMIELARLSRGYTQNDLVSLLDGVSQSTLSKFEKNQLQVSLSMVESLANVLNYPISFFLSGRR